MTGIGISGYVGMGGSSFRGPTTHMSRVAGFRVSGFEAEGLQDFITRIEILPCRVTHDSGLAATCCYENLKSSRAETLKDEQKHKRSLSGLNALKP